MIESFEQLINDTYRPTIDKIVDRTLAEAKQEQTWLAEYFPVQTYSDFHLLWDEVRTFPILGNFLAIEADVPIADMPFEATRRSTPLFLYHGQARRYTADDYKRLYEGSRLANAGDRNAATTLLAMMQSPVMEYQQRMLRTLNKMICDIISTGTCNMVDNKTNARVDFSYTPVPALIGGADTLPWANPAALGLDYLEARLEAFADEHNFYPNEILISRKKIRELLKQDYTIQRYTAQTNANFLNSLRTLNEGDLTGLLKAIRPEYPNVRIERGVYFEVPPGITGGYTRRPYINEDTLVFLTKSGTPNTSLESLQGGADLNDNGYEAGVMGVRALGPVVENNMNAGFYVDVERVSRVPIVEDLKVIVNAVPVVFDETLISYHNPG